MMLKLSKALALSMLRDAGADAKVISHSIAVSGLARDLAERISENGFKVDVDFVEIAALLHDIGRSRTHSVRHGVVGADILRDYPGYANVARTHIGGGIGPGEAERLGLPDGDYLPRTLEEKIVCYADKLVHGDEIKSMDETISKYSGRLGPDHPAIERMRRLHNEMMSYAQN
jgi:uncharacterized protein